MIVQDLQLMQFERGGPDFETVRACWVIACLCYLCLFAYQIHTLIRLMRDKALGDERTQVRQLTYAGIILFLPAGIGAAIFDWCERSRVRISFVIPLVALCLSVAIGFGQLLPVMTNFQFPGT